LVFFNSTILKIHKQREEYDANRNVNSNGEPPAAVVISNQSNCLSKLQPDMPRLLAFLDKGDDNLMLKPLAHFFDQ